jgi:hypothetical protein
VDGGLSGHHLCTKFKNVRLPQIGGSPQKMSVQTLEKCSKIEVILQSKPST